MRKVKSSLVFPGRKGPLTDIRDSLNGACERAGVPRIHVHGLRHTFGSQMAMAGADPFAIMKALGHSDLQMTMHYVSLGSKNENPINLCLCKPRKHHVLWWINSS